MSLQIKKWGNNQGIILSKDIMEKLNLHINDTLEADIEDEKLILRKKTHHLTLEERAVPYGGHINVMRMPDLEGDNPQGKEML